MVRLNTSEIQNLWPDEIKILTVDDEQDILNLIRLSLEPAGFRILRTTSPEDGLDLAMQEKPDLLLLDVMMPRLDGFELLRRIRRHPKVGQVPVIIISARAGSPDQLRMLRLSETDGDAIDAYLGKPFDPAQLLKMVKDILIKHRSYVVEKNHPQKKPQELQMVM